jgi:hypothetical protein
LPDGAVIHQRVVNSSEEMRVNPEERISVDIKYLNNTFEDMFTAYKEKLRQINIEKKKNRLSKALKKEEEKKKE